ncbi:glycosyl hydrolase catalytic core-domain-containing protein [Hypomontagnella submonticulosa]|nr:glycosyl hydrolase catalytic core-domain-containing protein [Hypomontagnella submonticulosa]
MYTKISLLALCAAASISEVAAGTIHRHQHPKREIVWAETDTFVVTEYVTMTVTAGQKPAAAAIPTPPAKPKGEGVKDHSAPSHNSASSSSSSIAVVPTPPVAVVNPPASKPTTLATSVKSAEKPVVETPAIKAPATQSSVVKSPPAQSPSVASPPAPKPTSKAAASPSPSPSPAPAPVKAATSKRGAAYNDPTLVTALLGLSNKISWAYNWGSDSGGLKANIDYYPMLWSPAPDHSNNWDQKAEAAIAKGSNCLLSFNEPDIASQANMSPQAAASGHIQYMNKYAGKARISAPAISSSQNANQGIDWLKQFFTACNGKCQVDFCAAHWYGPGGSDGAKLFLDHVKNVHTACQNKNVWVTEFAAESGDIDGFMSAVTKALDSSEYSFVEKYSYFMLNQGSLMSSATTLSSFGKIFAGLA